MLLCLSNKISIQNLHLNLIYFQVVIADSNRKKG